MTTPLNRFDKKSELYRDWSDWVWDKNRPKFSRNLSGLKIWVTHGYGMPKNALELTYLICVEPHQLMSDYGYSRDEARSKALEYLHYQREMFKLLRKSDKNWKKRFEAGEIEFTNPTSNKSDYHANQPVSKAAVGFCLKLTLKDYTIKEAKALESELISTIEAIHSGIEAQNLIEPPQTAEERAGNASIPPTVRGIEPRPPAKKRGANPRSASGNNR